MQNESVSLSLDALGRLHGVPGVCEFAEERLCSALGRNRVLRNV